MGAVSALFFVLPAAVSTNVLPADSASAAGLLIDLHLGGKRRYHRRLRLLSHRAVPGRVDACRQVSESAVPAQRNGAAPADHPVQ